MGARGGSGRVLDLGRQQGGGRGASQGTREPGIQRADKGDEREMGVPVHSARMQAHFGARPRSDKYTRIEEFHRHDEPLVLDKEYERRPT